MALNPTLQVGITPEAPVQQTSNIEAYSGLFGAIAGGLTAKRGDGPTQSDRDDAYQQGLRDELHKQLNRAQQYRSGGKPQDATRLERVAIVNYTKFGGKVDASTKEFIHSTTGRDVEEVGFSKEEVVRQSLEKTPEFSQAVLNTWGTHPDPSMPEAERMNLAHATLQRKANNEIMVQQTQFNWNNNQGQSSRMAMVDEFWNDNMGVLVLSGRENGKVDQNTVQRATLAFGALEQQILRTRPTNLSQEDWKPVQDYIDSTKKQLDLAERLTSNEEMASDQLRVVLDGIRALPSEIANDAEKNYAVLTLMDNRQNFVEMGLLTAGKLTEMLTAASKIKVENAPSSFEAGTGVSSDQATNSFSKQELDSVTVTNPAKNFEDADALTKLMGAEGNVVQDGKALSRWVGYASQGFANLYNMAATNKAWSTAEGYRSVFTDGFFKTMGELNRTGNGATYDAVRGKTVEAIETNQTTLRAGINAKLNGTAVRYNRATETLEMDWSALSLSDTGLKTKDISDIQQAINIFYGGDFQAAVKDKGDKIKKAAKNYNNFSEQDYANQNLAKNVEGSLGTLLAPFEDETIIQRLDAVKQLEAFKGRLPANEDKQGTTRVEGGSSGDRLGAEATLQQSRPRENTPGTMELIKSFEGFRSDAYYDVNAWRSGYGSDTVTRRDGTVEKITKNTKVTREDAERDLRRRVQEFQNTARGQVGTEVWTSLPGNVVDALTSVTYNYGSLPNSVVSAVKTGDVNDIATAVEGLAGHNDGINRKRRLREAAIIRGEATPSTAAPTYTDLPEERPFTMDTAEMASRRVVEERANTTEGGQGGSVSPAESREDPEMDTGSPEGKGITPERSGQVWSELSSQTKGLLLRLFGNEEGVRQALESGELSEKDIL